MWTAVLIIAWGLALFNCGRALAEPSLDWPAFIINAAVVIGAPIIGIYAEREART